VNQRFHDCQNYPECLSRAADTNTGLSCAACHKYQRKAYHPTIGDIAGCLALHLAIFHPDAYQQMAKQSEFKIWLLRSFMEVSTNGRRQNDHFEIGR
jgi:hypothetical protein